MKKTGFADLRLCEGYVPMYREMVKISKPIIELLIEEFGTKELIRRFSDPTWFQSLAVALGFEYNYTGATTVTIKAIKEAINNTDIPIKIAGGKGKLALKTPEEIKIFGEKLNLKEKSIKKLVEASKTSAKVDNAMIQDSFDIYFHSIIFDEYGRFSIINQGMNVRIQMVRRYHWYEPRDFIEEPHSHLSKPIDLALNLTLKGNREVRNTMLDIVRDHSIEWIKSKVLVLSKKLETTRTETLNRFLNISSSETKVIKLPYYLKFPKKIEERALLIAKEADNFKEFLLTKGMGPSTLRALAFISALIYGTEIVWEDPQIYAYAHGTKAGKPWYVEKKLMIENAKILEEIVKEAKLGNKEKTKILRRLAKIVEKYSNR